MKTIIKVKNTLQAIKRRLNAVEEWFTDWKTEQWKSLKLNRNNFFLSQNISRTGSRILTVILQASRRRRKREIENECEETLAEKFPSLGRETDTPAQKAQTVPIKSTQRGSHQDTVCKTATIKYKERI